MNRFFLLIFASMLPLVGAQAQEPETLVADMVPVETAVDVHAADSISALRLRLQPKPIVSNPDTNNLTIIDTL
ncbi:MAG: metalloendopeptidase, partial [Alistipes sp.]|nr:metalloendopeptidase [Alistipes sp.]